MGNICRSPSAEAVMKKLAQERGANLFIDSAGTIAHHAGEPADARMKHHALQRGYYLSSISRPVKTDDFRRFDMIIGMDAANVADLEARSTSEEECAKLSLMTDYCRHSKSHSVPDPYYGGSDGFELVLDLLEDACEGLLEHILSEREKNKAKNQFNTNFYKPL